MVILWHKTIFIERLVNIDKYFISQLVHIIYNFVNLNNIILRIYARNNVFWKKKKVFRVPVKTINLLYHRP